MEINKKCEVCGRLLPEYAFSKSYKNRCKECVAKQTREKRFKERNINGSKKFSGRLSEVLDMYYQNHQKPTKQTITINITGKGLFVDYQAAGSPAKNWKDCDTYELITINAAAKVLIAGTEFTTQFGKIVGNLVELSEMLGINITEK